jgi:hypothetical protein
VAGATIDLRYERVHPGEPAVAVTDADVEGDVDVIIDIGARRRADRHRVAQQPGASAGRR